MRPKKRILLAAQCEARLSVLKFKLQTWSYAVGAARDATEAMEALKRAAWDVVLIDWPMNGADRLISAAHRYQTTRTLAFAEAAETLPEGCAAEVVIVKDGASCLRDQVATLAAKRRGPRRWKTEVRRDQLVAGQAVAYMTRIA